MPDPVTLYVADPRGAQYDRPATPAEVLAHPAVVAEIAHLDEHIAALQAFAARCQRAHATPGCEREPLRDAAWCLDRLARKVEETADAREALTAERDRLRDVLDAARTYCEVRMVGGWTEAYIRAQVRLCDVVKAADRAGEGRKG